MSADLSPPASMPLPDAILILLYHIFFKPAVERIEADDGNEDFVALCPTVLQSVAMYDKACSSFARDLTLEYW